MKKRLTEMETGKKAVIISLENDDILLKLMEMGCLPGEIIIIEKKLICSKLKRFSCNFFTDKISNIFKAGSNLICVNNHAMKIIICFRIFPATFD